MSDGKKTIKINPEIFNIGTRKNRDKKKTAIPTTPPVISPNLLKNKLLKRIKEHKVTETKNNPTIDEKKEETNFSDEFHDSIEYLQSLSKQKKKEQEIDNKKNNLLKKTVRSYESVSHPHVELELPEDLMPTPTLKVSNDPSIHLNYQVDNAVPYGCLKGGYKPTYRNLNKTRKVYEVTTPTSTLNVGNINAEREQRLHLLKNKIKSQQVSNTNSLSTPPKKETSFFIDTSTSTSTTNFPINNFNSTNDKSIIKTSNLDIPNKPIPETVVTPSETSQFIKKTTKKTYTLGKSKTNRSVGILIKDNKTRKNIINAQKELKHHAISDVKKYLILFFII